MEFDETIQPDLEERVSRLRGKIPKPVLAHYDRLTDHGKKGLAGVQHQTCTGCHLQVPLGVVIELQHTEDVRLCDNCGRYLYLLEDVVAAEAPPAPVKTAPKSKRKQLAHAQ